MNPQTSSLRLYSAQVCPFAQRTRLVLFTKGLDFELVEIDLDQPPPEFHAISPYGKVPLLEWGEERVWESAVINEFIEECFPDPPLMPREPGPRATVRIWIDYANNYFVPLFYKLLLKQTAEEQNAVAERLTESLRFLETQALAAASPYWMGKQANLVDFSFHPFFERFPVLEHYRGFTIPDDCRRLARWLEAMAELPAVRHYANPADFYLKRYARYANATVDNDTAREMLEK